mmetsp:Transcript_31353/g.61394  ORF Transcript_31353/g.61394 Transcript_31353/m.61394 type:complete len:183 (+) Transcript_31353:165-713(+)
MTPALASKKVNCSNCSRPFSAGNMWRHKLIHKDLRPHVCMKCNATHRLRAHLIRHMRVHSGERPFNCSHNCNMTFADLGTLKRHEDAIHSKAKKFCCFKCNKRFSTTSNLRTHIRVHTGDRPFQCSLCRARFTDMSNRNSHFRRHLTNGWKPNYTRGKSRAAASRTSGLQLEPCPPKMPQCH